MPDMFVEYRRTNAVELAAYRTHVGEIARQAYWGIVRINGFDDAYKDFFWKTLHGGYNSVAMRNSSKS